MITLDTNLSVSGRFSIDVLDKNGELIPEKCLPEQRNLFTEYGLTTVLDLTSSSYSISVGSGSTPPAHTDLHLEQYVATTNSSVGFNTSTANPLERTITASATATFNLGAVVGNISEIGLTHYNSANPSQPKLVTRSLIKDINGLATVITLASDQQLRVTYTVSTTIAPTPAPYTIPLTVDGVVTNVTVTSDFALRGSSYTNVLNWGWANPPLYASDSQGSNPSPALSRTSVENSWNESRTVYTSVVKCFAGIETSNGTINYIVLNDDKSISTPDTFQFTLNPSFTKTSEQIMTIYARRSVTYG